MRDVWTDPQPGDMVHAAQFCGGAVLTVIRLCGRGVHFRIEADDGRSVEQRGRIWSLATWSSYRNGGDEIPPQWFVQ